MILRALRALGVEISLRPPPSWVRSALNPSSRSLLVRGTIQGPMAAAAIVTVWIVLHGEDFPRFVTDYRWNAMKTPPFHELDTVLLLREIPEAGLRAGDLGAVVLVYDAEALEVEFVTASRRTQALLTLPASDVRPGRDDDLLAVRSAPPVRGTT
jgi:hypothetical protein